MRTFYHKAANAIAIGIAAGIVFKSILGIP